MSIFVDRGERGLIVGQTGSGKSVMLQEQCRHAPISPVIIYDTKGDDGFFDVPTDEEEISVIESLDDFKRYTKQPRRKWSDYLLIRPNNHEVGEPKILDQYLLHHYDRCKQSYCMIDEAYQMHENGKAGPGLLGIYTRGRSQGISAVACTQRPKWVSRFLLTEAQKIYIYSLTDIDDRKRMGEISPYPWKKRVDKFHFYYYKQGEEFGTLFEPLPLRVDRGWVPDDLDTDNLTWL